MIIETMPIAALKPAGYNPRKNLKPGDPEYDKLKRSIEAFGYVEPIIFNRRSGHIIGGHQRLKVLLDLGYSEAECVVVDLGDAEEKTLNIALNKISGEWDIPMLKDLFQNLSDGGGCDLMLSGFDLQDIDDLLAPIIAIGEDSFDVDKATEDAAVNTDVKVGDIYVMGKHRLMCGDSTSVADMDALMDGSVADMIFTDPPYGVNIGRKNRCLDEIKKSRRCTEDIAGDNLTPSDLHKLLLPAFSNIRARAKDACAIYVTAPQGRELLDVFCAAMQDAGIPVKHILIWVKNQPTFSMGRLDYEYQHEPILYTWTKTRKHPGKGNHRTSIWAIDRPRASKSHPTIKPIELVANALLNSTDRGDIVLDAFLGSGTTLIACEQTGRACRGMELSPQYCQVIIDRWKAFTCREPKKVSG